MTVLVAADLDRTLIYSAAALARHGTGGRRLTCVERYRDADASWLTAPSAAALTEVVARSRFVPVTTRTVEQWQRIALPVPAPPIVAVANGAVLLVDGRPDEAWTGAVATVVAASAPLAEVLAHVRAGCPPEATSTVRVAADVFCYAVVDRHRLPAGFVDTTRAWSAERGWRVSLQGRKLYWVPAGVTKAAAAAEIARRLEADVVLAAGDSLLDADLLAGADEGIVARHGELVASGWSAPHVTVTTDEGVLAGEQIVRWLAERVTAAAR